MKKIRRKHTILTVRNVQDEKIRVKIKERVQGKGRERKRQKKKEEDMGNCGSDA